MSQYANPSYKVMVNRHSEEGSLCEHYLATTWNIMKSVVVLLCVSDHGDVCIAPERT